MTTNYGQQVYSQGSGTASTTLFDAVRLPRNPTTADVGYALGKNWVNTTTNAVWYLASQSSNAGILQANWVNLGAGSILAGVDTINTVAPDGGGNFTLSSSNGSIAISPIVNGLDLTVASSPTKYDGNTGGDVVPDGTNTLFIVGNNTTGINVVGNSPMNTLTISSFQATTAQEGTVTLATNAQAIAGTDAANAVTSAALAAKLGTQTNHSLALFKGSTAALSPLGVASNGQIPIGSTGADPVLANITSTGGTIAITNGAGSINLDIAGGSAAIEKFLPDSGTTPVVPDGSGQVTMAGSGSTTTVGGLNSLTFQLTGLTNHAVLVGAGTTTITKVGPTATSGQVLQSSGAAADPAFSTATYPSTTTINQILYSSSANTVSGLTTANRAVLTTGATGIPVLTALATDGQLIIGSTAGVPAAATLTAGTGISITNASNSITIAVASGSAVVETLTGNSGGAISPTAGNINTLGTGSITIAGAGSTLTTQLTGLTNHAVLVGAGTATITNVGPTSTSGQVLQSQGALADPAFSTATYPSTTTINQILYSSSANTVAGLATANRGVLTTGATGVPVVTALATDGQLIIGSTAGAPAAATLTAGSGISITNGSNSISIAVSGGTSVVQTLTGNTGGAISPTAGNINTLGTGSITIAGSGSTLTTQLTGLTNHNVLIGAGTATITNVAPSATSGVPLISQGAAADPAFGTAVVAGGGTGITSATAYAVICGGTTSTNPFQSIAGVGTSGQVLTSNGAGALPTFQASSGSFTFTINIQTFTSSGTYTPTANMKYCIIECVGGGGGGGGAASAAASDVAPGGGGGGGGYARKFASSATIGGSQTVTIGAAGSAGSAGNNVGGNGGDTSVGAICIGKGGTGGSGNNGSSNVAGGAGGVAGTGDLTFPGQPGGNSWLTTAGAIVGNGGGTYFGGATASGASLNAAGVAGQNYGTGGTGGISYNGGGAFAGGAGAKGVVIITEYIIS